MRGWIINYNDTEPSRTDEHLHQVFARCFMENYNPECAANETHLFDKYAVTFCKLAAVIGMPVNEWWEKIRIAGGMGIPSFRGPIHIYTDSRDVRIDLVHLMVCAQKYFPPEPEADTIVVR